eukprot:2943327-Pyramimonas_sp.AAC.1
MNTPLNPRKRKLTARHAKMARRRVAGFLDNDAPLLLMETLECAIREPFHKFQCTKTLDRQKLKLSKLKVLSFHTNETLTPLDYVLRSVPIIARVIFIATLRTVFVFLDAARPRQAIGQAERREGGLREASPRGSVGGGRASSRKSSYSLHFSLDLRFEQSQYLLTVEVQSENDGLAKLLPHKLDENKHSSLCEPRARRLRKCRV